MKQKTQVRQNAKLKQRIMDHSEQRMEFSKRLYLSVLLLIKGFRKQQINIKIRGLNSEEISRF